jgi:serine/threonine protein kinase
MFIGSDRHIRLYPPNDSRNYFELDHITYEALPLDPSDEEKGIGINSSVFRARRADDDKNVDEFAVKVCAFWIDRYLHKRAERFQREVNALRIARDNVKTNYIVELIADGFLWIRGRQHQCHLCELGGETLDEFLEKNPNIILQQRLLLCLDLLRSIKALHELGIYHRDIKPQNFLSFDGRWKVGDLGLIQHRMEDLEIDGHRERVGPIKWMTPEAWNRQMFLKRADNAFIDRNFCDKTDVYLLGKLFWYIIQGDVPNGCLKSSDLRLAGDDIYGSFLKPMLGYARCERPSLQDVYQRLEPLRRRYAF